MSDEIPAAARTAFLALKALTKRYLNDKFSSRHRMEWTKADSGNKIPSFALKCTMYRCVESKRPDYWNGNEKEIVEEVFLYVLRFLFIMFIMSI